MKRVIAMLLSVTATTLLSANPYDGMVVFEGEKICDEILSHNDKIEYLKPVTDWIMTKKEWLESEYAKKHSKCKNMFDEGFTDGGTGEEYLSMTKIRFYNVEIYGERKDVVEGFQYNNIPRQTTSFEEVDWEKCEIVTLFWWSSENRIFRFNGNIYFETLVYSDSPNKPKELLSIYTHSVLKQEIKESTPSGKIRSREKRETCYYLPKAEAIDNCKRYKDPSNQYYKKTRCKDIYPVDSNLTQRSK